MEKTILKLDDTPYETLIPRKFINRKKNVPQNNNFISAFIPGTIRNIYVKIGEKVKKGDKLLVLEAMKMKNIINSPIGGVIKSINVKENQSVAKNDLLIEIQ